jgi:hypothetical protein
VPTIKHFKTIRDEIMHDETPPSTSNFSLVGSSDF